MMAKRCTFVFDRPAFRDQVLKNRRLQDMILTSCQMAVTDRRCMVREHYGENRNGAAILCPMPVEAAHGTLEDALSRMVV